MRSERRCERNIKNSQEIITLYTLHSFVKTSRDIYLPKSLELLYISHLMTCYFQQSIWHTPYTNANKLTIHAVWNVFGISLVRMFTKLKNCVSHQEIKTLDFTSIVGKTKEMLSILFQYIVGSREVMLAEEFCDKE